MNFTSSPNLKLKFIIVLLLAVIFFLLDVVAEKFYLYWTYDWLDALMHFFGGVLAATFFVLVMRAVASSTISRGKVLLVSSVSALVIGIAWEIFEHEFGISHWSPLFVADTVSDLSMDIIGGLTAYLVWTCFNRSTKKNLNQNE